MAPGALALDREAFSISNYDLNVRIEPEQHRLGVRGKVILRNDSQSAQKIAVLQISSSLDWRSVKVSDQAVQFVTQTYTSDIDHTGSLSEAIVTLPQPVAPQGTVELEIAYEGVILLDATRLTRIGTPEEAANSTDWDQIDEKFSAVRGVGYVAWYPIATEVANLSEGNSLFEVVNRWKTREAGSKMHLHFERSGIFVPACGSHDMDAGVTHAQETVCTFDRLGAVVPSFVIADYEITRRPNIDVHYLRGHDSSAVNYADEAEKISPLIAEWFGTIREKAQTADLPDPNAAPFESGSFLLTPFGNSDSKLAGLAAAHQLTHAAFFSFRPWIEEGLAHFAQALYLEREKGRAAAIEYMGLHRFALGQLEQSTAAPRSEDEVKRSLVNTISEELYRSKAMFVWWMLRDIVGDAALKKALAAYRPEQDKEPSYMQRLIAAHTPRDLEWFFDDWVYRDRGLPDFKVDSVFPHKTMTGLFIVTVTIDNSGTAGAEVPVIVKFAGGEIMRRLVVQAKNKAVIRVEVAAAPQEVVVNDGSVPESDVTNNVFKVESVEK
ncbi:MAG TPA: hypothetical protein VGM18_12415 [Candidatus Sulfotelmatobacter sp.]